MRRHFLPRPQSATGHRSNCTLASSGTWRTRQCLLAVGALVAAIIVGVGVPASANSKHAAGSNSKQTITVWGDWANTGPGLQAQRQLNTGFEKKYPQYKIDFVNVPFADFSAKMDAAIAAHSGPNVVNVYPGVVAAAFRNGLVPLQSMLTAQNRQTWLLLSSANSPDGNLYSVPWTEYGYFFYYNKKLFKKAGLNPNKTPSTWQQFLHDCSVLKAHKIVPMSVGFKDGFDWEWYAFPMLDQLMSRTETTQWLDYKVSITSAPFPQVWTMIKSLGTDGYFASDAYALNLYNDSYTNFGNGKDAMVLDAPTISDLTSAQKELGSSNVGVFPFPRLPGSKWAPFVDAGPSAGWGITKWTTDRKGAWDYISYLESPSSESLAWKTAGAIPNNSQVATPTNDSAVKSILAALKNPLDHTIYTGFPLSVLGINERYASEMIQGQISTTQVLQMMEQLRESLAPTLK